MARKRLSDLLREEVHKTADAEVTSIETSDKRQPKANRPKTELGPKKAESSIETVDAVLLEAEESKDTQQLKQELARSQQRETALQQELIDLQTELDQQEALIQTLKADLERAESFKIELGQAKKAALQLAEENTRLSQELELLRSQKKAEPSEQKAEQKVQQKLAPLDESGKSTSTNLIQQRQARSLAHPIFPAGSSPGHLSEQDLGWVD